MLELVEDKLALTQCGLGVLIYRQLNCLDVGLAPYPTRSEMPSACERLDELGSGFPINETINEVLRTSGN